MKPVQHLDCNGYFQCMGKYVWPDSKSNQITIDTLEGRKGVEAIAKMADVVAPVAEWGKAGMEASKILQ